MQRRDFFRALGMAGAVTASGRIARGQSWGGPDAGAGRTKVEDGHTGPWPHWPYEEIRVPYRERFGKIKWPNHGPLCVYIYVTGEWGGHATLSDPKAKFTRDIRTESERGQYEFNVGIWRAVRLLDKFGLKVSIFSHTGMMEVFPDLFRELHSKGHEIITRPFTGEPTTRMTPAEERKEIQLITKVFEKVIGERPVGFDNPGGVTTDKTPDILADEGYLWMGGLKGDDLPYGIKTSSGKKLIVIGSRHTTTNDNAIFEMRGLRGPSAAFEYMKDIFDAYYRLGREEFPCALNYGIHPANGLLPERVSFQERFLDYMLQFKNVWFARCGDLADYWMKNYV